MTKDELVEKIETIKKALDEFVMINTEDWSDDDKGTYHQIVEKTKKMLDSYLNDLEDLQK